MGDHESVFKWPGFDQKGGYRFSDALALLGRFFRFEYEDLKILLPVSVSYGLLTLTVPLGTQVLVNRILATALPTQALSVVTLITLGLIAAAFLRITQRVLVEKMQRRFHSRIVLTGADTAFHDRHPRASHLYYDTFIVQKSLSTLLMEGLGVAIQLLFALSLLAFYHPFFLAFDLAVVGGLFVVVGLPMSHLIRTATEESKAKHATARFLAEIREETSADTYLETADDTAISYLKARLSHFRAVIAQMIGLAGLHVIANALLLGFGSFFVIQEQMSLGQLVAAELVFSAAFLSVEKLNKHLETFYDLIAALQKLTPISGVEPGMPRGANHE